jgi:hypothetical protein
MVLSDKKIYEFTPEQTLNVKMPKGNFRGSLVQVKNILKEIAQRVNA